MGCEVSDQQTVIPEWVATMVGRLTLENEALRLALAQQAPPPSADDQPEP